MRRTVAINLSVFCLALAALELSGQLYYRWTRGQYLADRAQQTLREATDHASVFERHPYLVARPRADVRVTRGDVTISTTASHTRATSARAAAPDALTIAAVGGSTTFGTRLTDADTWPWLLQEKLGDGYSVLNYGVPGYTTAENIIQMALTVPEARPHVVIFYEGWNDIRNYHWPGFESDYSRHGLTQFDTLIPPVLDRAPLLERAARYSVVLWLLGRATGVPVAAAGLASDAHDPDVDRVYVRNLRTLKTLAARFGMTALFVPQVLNEEAFARAGDTPGWAPYVRNAAMPALMRGFNRLMATVCADADPQCAFVGEALTASWNNDDFVDEGHFSRRGGEKLAAILNERIRQMPPHAHDPLATGASE